MARRKPARRSARPRPRSRRPAAKRRIAKPAARKRTLKTARRSRKQAAGRGRTKAKAVKARRQLSPARPKPKASRPKKAAAPVPARPVARVTKAATAVKAAKTVRTPAARPVLDRERRRLPEDERVSSGMDSDARALAETKTGHTEIFAALERHRETSPAMTAGDLDAKWEDAYAVGDEAPGGDNPTPDQDRVDDIGLALGVTYDDNEELRPNDKVADRDAHRWELDPASSDDWPHDGSDAEKDEGDE